MTLMITPSGGSGTVTSVAALTLGTTGTDVSSTVTNGTTAPVITLNLPTASSSARGLLSSADWTTFNNKGSGTVTSASVVSANGFTGTVATSTTTPAITISTSISGMLKGNGTAISAATAGTDYVAPGGALGTPSSGTLTNCTFPTLNQSTTGAAGSVTGTNLGKTGAQGFFTTTSWTSTDWSNLAIGGGGMAIASTPGAPNTNYGYFIKMGNRDAGGGWGGLWQDYSAGDLYFGNTTVSTSNATWKKVWDATNLTNLNQLTNGPGYVTSSGVTSVATGTGLSGGTITTTGTISLANTAVTAGSYTAANITVDAQGRITAASNGSAGYGAATLRNVTSGYTGGGQVFIAGTAPTANAAGDIWLDTSGADSYTQNLASSGYTKLPNGFMMVWNTSSYISQDGSAAQTFPYAFPNLCFHVFLTLQGGINTGGGGSDAVTSISKTGFTLNHGSDPARYLSYLAIGY